MLYKYGYISKKPITLNIEKIMSDCRTLNREKTHYSGYSKEFNIELKTKIKKRDNYSCKLCDRLQFEIVFPIHHIDYNTENNNEFNLITLCSKCHGKTSTHREHWMEKLSKLITT
jgi:5-methylcytosine-specific restriction endonuclease McrA